MTIASLLEPEATRDYEAASSEELVFVALDELTVPCSALCFSAKAGYCPKFLFQVWPVTKSVVVVFSEFYENICNTFYPAFSAYVTLSSV